MIIIFGACGTIKDTDSFVQHLLLLSKKENLVIQVFDASAIYGKDHLISATIHAQRAFEQGRNSTNSLALEILLYAAGERQIHKAIKKIGVKKGKQQIVFLLTNDMTQKTNKPINKAVIQKLLETFDFILDDKVLEGNRDTLKRFGISEQELLTIPESHYGDLILEKVALVDVIK
jgi:KEOPS complex subunit Cgi121